MDVWILCGWELGEGEHILGVFASQKDAYIAMKVHFNGENEYEFLDYKCYQFRVGKTCDDVISVSWWEYENFDELDKRYLEV
jgi:hypothetical protein